MSELAESYAAKIAKATSDRRYGIAEEYFKQYLKLGVFSSNKPFLYMIRAYHNLKEFERVLEIWEVMVTVGVPLDSACYSVLIQALVNLFRHTNVNEVFSDMRRRGLTPDLKVHNALLGGFVAVRKEEEAQEVYTTIEKKFGMNELSSCHMLCLHCKYRRWKEAEKIWGIMKENNFVRTSDTFNRVMGAYVKCGKPESVEGLFQELKSMGIAPTIDTYNILLHSYLKLEDWRKFFLLWKKLKRGGPPPDTVTCALVMLTYQKMEAYEKIIELHGQMRKNGLAPNKYTYYYVLMAYMKIGDVENVLKTISDVKKLKLRVRYNRFRRLISTWLEFVKDSGIEFYADTPEMNGKDILEDKEGPTYEEGKEGPKDVEQENIREEPSLGEEVLGGENLELNQARMEGQQNEAESEPYELEEDEELAKGFEGTAKTGKKAKNKKVKRKVRRSKTVGGASETE
jgi:pentatricopeptide repeat protein